MPPIVFDRNLHRTPLMVRTSDVMWAAAGISTMYSGSKVCIPTSVYTLPLTLVEHVQGWDCGPGAIGEDLHMFLKCFFALSGNLRTQIIYAAASQCNVSSGHPGFRGYAGGVLARYQQAVRHMWGAMDTGYAVRQAVLMLGRSGSPSRGGLDEDLSARKSVFEPPCLVENDGKLMYISSNWTAFCTYTGLHRALTGRDTTSPVFASNSIHWHNVLTVFYRLFEAHFMPVHLALILTTSTSYGLLFPRFLMPTVLRVALDICSWCRLAGFCLMICGFYRYEQYHRLCIGLRKEEMRKAGLLEGMTQRDSFSPNVFMYAGIAEAGLFVVGGFLYGAVPALQAELSHFFTERLTYIVSLKP